MLALQKTSMIYFEGFKSRNFDAFFPPSYYTRITSGIYVYLTNRK